MTKRWKSVLALWAIGSGFGVCAPALAANAVGPYYATPSWDQTLPAASRFIVLTNMNSEAVLDRETGLVWEQSPSTSQFEWTIALIHCVQLNKGSRKGWRLPTIQDLASLIDPTVSSPGPTLPTGHPFSNVSTTFVYWSASTPAYAPSSAWYVAFIGGFVTPAPKTDVNVLAWCVRGGQGVDPQ